MPSGTTERLEGMIVAHRKILARLVAAADDATFANFLAAVENKAPMHDGQEDPGAVPTDGLAVGMIIEEEIKMAVNLAKAIRKPDPGDT